MPQFRFNAIDSDGREVTGRLEAPSPEAATAQLESTGHREIAVEPEAILDEGSAEPESRGVALQEDDFLTVGDSLATLTAAGLPLESGLRALAEDVRSKRVARALTAMSERLDKGEAWEAIVAGGRTAATGPLAKLFGCGLSPGDLSQVLTGYMRYVREAADVRRKIRNGLFYSGLLLGSLVVVVLFFLMVLFPEMMDIFEGFGTDLPETTSFLGYLSLMLQGKSLPLLAGFGILALACYLLKYLPGRALRARLWTAIPWVGIAYRNNSRSTFCHLLGVLVERNVPIDVALQVAGAACRNADLERACSEIVASLERGVSLEQAAKAEFALPERVAQIFAGSGRRTGLQDVLHAAGAAYAGEARTRAELIPLLVEPAVLILIVPVMATLVFAIFTPLIKLLNDLS